MAFSSLYLPAFCVVLLVASAPKLSRSFPGGPPVAQHFDNVCNLMTPLHNGNLATAGNGGFFVETDLPRIGYGGFNYTAGTTYTVTLSGSENTFRGFLVIAHVPGEDHFLLGSFIPQNGSQQILNCSVTGASSEMESTIAHNNSDLIDFENITMKWKAPSDQDGMVDFRFSVVHNFTTFYVYQRASLNGLTQPTKDPENYRLTFRSPSNCRVSSCDVFVGIDTNVGDSAYLDIYLEGAAGGWVAVGFTETRSMFSSAVVACNRDPSTDVVEVLDTYNAPDKRANELTPVQNVVKFVANYSDGRISCSLAKKIVADDPPPVDVNLDSDLYILYGRRSGISGMRSLRIHDIENPKISAKKYNPFNDSDQGQGDNFPKLSLIRAHGIFMLIAWPLLAVSGIFFASWMKPALPNGEWFQVHMVLMLASLFVGIVGVAMVFIGHAHEDNPRGLIELGKGNPTGTAHFTIGLVIILLQIVNPILAIFRCKKDDKRRWVFNVIHGMANGLGAQLLAFVNVGLGTYIYNNTVSSLFWVYVSYIVVIVILFSLLYLIFTASAILNRKLDGIRLAPSLLKPLFKLLSPSSAYSTGLTSSESFKVSYSTTEDSRVPMISTEKVKQLDGSSKSAVRSKDSYVRWTSFVVYLIFTTPLIVAMVILAAVGPLSG